MKKIINIFILSIVMLAFYACRKNDNPKLPDGITKGIFPQLVQDTGGDVSIQDVANFSTSFTLGLYFPNGDKPQKMDVRVLYNEDYNNVKTFQANITTFPATIKVTGPQLTQLFGKANSDIKKGDFFTFMPDITLKNGTVLPAFSRGISGTDTIVLAPYGSDPQNFPGANVSIAYEKE